MSKRARVARRVLAATLVVAGLLLARRAYEAWRPLPGPTPGDVARGERSFLFSDLGSKDYGAIPRAVYEALPVLFPEEFVEGWRGIGVLPNPEDPDGPPIGTARVTVLGVESYSPNCALCHVGEHAGKLVVGAPNVDFDVQRMVYAIGRALESERLSVDAVADLSAKKGRPLSRAHRWGIGIWLGAARRKHEQGRKDWFKNELGPGRSDALNQWKRTLGVVDETHPSWVDIPPIYNQRLKKHTLLDGSVSGDPAVRIMLTEIQKGRPFRDPLLHREVFDDIAAYVVQKLEPPKFPSSIDGELAGKGRTVFEGSCATCHGSYGPGPRTYPDKRVELGKAGTDPERALAMSDDVKAALERSEYGRFLSIETKPAYAPPPLDGVWMTAPYLHNGSVPTLWHMLHPDQRPVTFVRGFNDFDPVRIGFVCKGTPDCGPDDRQKTHDSRRLFTFDTRQRGNRNTGHTFGSSLEEDEKQALLEYLKTL